jgi:hypothetical protein
MAKPLCNAEAYALMNVRGSEYCVPGAAVKRYWKRRCNRARRRYLKRETRGVWHA